MKNILQIIDYAAPYKGNFIPSMEMLEAYWKSYGNMAFLMPDVAQPITWVGEFSQKHKVYFISRQFFSKKINWKHIAFLNDIIRNENIDIIHTHFMFYNYSLLLWRKIYGKRIKIIGHFHGEYAYKGKPYMIAIKHWVDNHLYDTIVGVSDFVSEGVHKKGLKRPKIMTLYNAIRFDRLDQYDKSFHFDKKDYECIVMMFGWPYKVKGVDVAIRAIRKINKDKHEVMLAIGYSGAPNVLKNEIIEDIGYFPDFISILPPREDVATYYNASDIFLSASRTEGFSYALLEASYSAPLIVTNDLYASTVANIPNVYTYPMADEQRLISTLFYVLTISKEEKQKIKEKQKKYIVQNYNLEKWIDEVVSLYNDY